MIRLFRPAYESEATQFLNRLKAERPELEQRQAEGRRRLWDTEPTSLDEQRRRGEARAAQPAYVYQQMAVLPPEAVALAPDAQLHAPEQSV